MDVPENRRLESIQGSLSISSGLKTFKITVPSANAQVIFLANLDFTKINTSKLYTT